MKSLFPDWAVLGRPLGWLQLTGERMRLLAATLGIAFAVLLMMMELGLHDALYESTTRLHNSLRADLVVVSTEYQYLGEPASFTERRLAQVLGDPAVRAVTPILLTLVDWKNPETRRTKRIFVVAFDPSRCPLSLPEVEANLETLRKEDHVLFDRASRVEYGKVEAALARPQPVITELANRRITVGGLFTLGASFTADGNLITSDLTLRRLVSTYPPGIVSLGLIQLKPQSDPALVRDRLRQRLLNDVDVLTRDDYSRREQRYWARRTPIGFVVTAGLLVGFAVGAVIVYQILYTDVIDHLSEYATLKAIGYTDRFLFTVVLQQSVILSLLGFLPGVLLSGLLYVMIRRLAHLPAELTLGRSVAVLLLTVLMCALAGGLAMRRLRAADPAEVF